MAIDGYSHSKRWNGEQVAGNDLHVTAGKALFLIMINKLCPEEKCDLVSCSAPLDIS